MNMSPRNFVFSIALLLPASQLSANDSPLERKTLSGLTALSVVVDPPEQALQDRGLAVAMVETEVEQRLLKAGVHLDKNAKEFIGIKIIAAHAKKTDFAICILLGVYQPVCLRRSPTVVTAAPTWTTESVLLVAPVQGSLGGYARSSRRRTYQCVGSGKRWDGAGNQQKHRGVSSAQMIAASVDGPRAHRGVV